MHKEFMAEINADPDNDLPRLVYADWLEEQGDPRGEFIRVQCERERLREIADRSDEEQELLDTLWSRGFKLEREHLKEWKAKLPKFREVRYGERFVRGFIPDVCIGDFARFVKAAHLMFYRTVVTDLTIGRAPREELLGLDPEAITFPLKKLTFGSGGGHLEFGIPGTQAIMEWSCLERLEQLNLERCSIQDQGVKIICESNSCTGLQSLNISGNELTDQSLQTLAECEKLKGLTDLNISFNGLTTHGAQALRNASYRESLEEIDFRENLEFRDGLVPLLDHKLFPNLRILDLMDTDATDQTAIALANSPQLESISSLCLGGCIITDEGALALARSPYANNLSDLTLSERESFSDSVRDELRSRFGQISWMIYYRE